MTAAPQHGGAVAGVKLSLLIKGLVLIASLAALGWGLKSSGLGDMLDSHWVDAQVKGHGLNGEMIFLAIGTIAIAAGLPRQAVCFLAGYAFGFVEGVAWSSLASLLGCVVCFAYARLLGRELVLHKFAARVKKIDDFLRGNPITMTVLIRFLPVGSNLVTNLLAGVSSVRPWPFIVGSMIGYTPQTIIFVLLGSGIQVDPAMRISLSVGLFVLSAALGAYLYKRLRHGRSLDADIDEALDEA
jgi:uncharacterized membrane protein YdjX (TVP38/TMEM64 family)